MVFEVCKKNLEIVQGDTVAFGLEFEEINDTGDFIDLTSAYFTVRDDFDESIKCQSSLGNGIAKEEVGLYSVSLSHEQTAELEPGTYYYDMQVGLGTEIYTIFVGVMTVLPSVTGGEPDVQD